MDRVCVRLGYKFIIHILVLLLLDLAPPGLKFDARTRNYAQQLIKSGNVRDKGTLVLGFLRNCPTFRN